MGAGGFVLDYTVFIVFSEYQNSIIVNGYSRGFI